MTLSTTLPLPAHAQCVIIGGGSIGCSLAYPGTTQLNVHGPQARAVLQKVSTADLSNAGFPFMSARRIDLGFFDVLAPRVTYIGELGWELHVPTLHALQVYDLLMDAGRELGLRNAGMQTLSSLRLEKAYRDFGVDLDNTDNPIEAGPGFTQAAVRRRNGAHPLLKARPGASAVSGRERCRLWRVSQHHRAGRVRRCRRSPPALHSNP